jgi:fused signal recognition particle receptor
MERLGPDSVIPSITRKVAGPYRFHGFIEFLRGKVFLMFEFVPDVFAQSPNRQELADPVQTSSWSWEALIVTGLLVVIAAVMFWVLTRRKVSTAPPAPSLPKTEKRTPTALTPKSEPPSVPAPRAPERPQEVQDILQDNTGSWLGRLKAGLSKTRQQLQDNIARMLGTSKVFDESTLEQIHEVLYRSDMGVETADYLVESLRKKFLGQSEGVGWDAIAGALEEAVVQAMGREEKALAIPAEGPQVILIVGVNGVGKTTSIGKLAARYIAQGRSVLLCAGDTYRAAAIEQLQVWGDRLGVPVIKHQQGSDPASVAFDGVKAAKSRGVDVLLIDTAGRLHNKQELMDELAKVKRVVGKELPGAPHEVWLVIDATTGQNAFQQVKAFQDIVQLTGLVITKLDGTAKGGVIIGIRRKFELPIRYIGVGEKAADLKEFSPPEYAASLFAQT